MLCPCGTTQSGCRLAHLRTRTGMRSEWDVGAGLNRVLDTINFMRMRRANKLHCAANSFDVGTLFLGGRACLTRNTCLSGPGTPSALLST